MKLTGVLCCDCCTHRWVLGGCFIKAHTHTHTLSPPHVCAFVHGGNQREANKHCLHTSRQTIKVSVITVGGGWTHTHAHAHTYTHTHASVSKYKCRKVNIISGSLVVQHACDTYITHTIVIIVFVFLGGGGEEVWT